MNTIMYCVPHDLHAVASYVILLVQSIRQSSPILASRELDLYNLCICTTTYVMTGKHIAPTFPLHRSSELQLPHLFMSSNNSLHV
jgi:hypothetical protein